ncbi:hypothetical protein ULG90_01015 [Halopseudomonas pachastrellae]|nr:hypothetical protein ULG90_01015 [Halopseudomonas pachastrellae]
MGVVQAAHRAGVLKEVLVGEACPSRSGARLAAWELQRTGVPCSLIADTAAASSMKYDPVSWVVVGAERIAANGDVITTQGTYALAILAMHHGLRFMWWWPPPPGVAGGGGCQSAAGCHPGRAD